MSSDSSMMFFESLGGVDLCDSSSSSLMSSTDVLCLGTGFLTTEVRRVFAPGFGLVVLGFFGGGAESAASFAFSVSVLLRGPSNGSAGGSTSLVMFKEMSS